MISRETLSPASCAASFVAQRWLSLKYAGTLMTASSTGSPRNRSASCFICLSTNAESSSGRKTCCPRGISRSVPI